MDIQKNRKEHMLKTDPAVFQDVLDGSKTFEIRFNDRGYQIGDLIVLKETKFTGQQMKSGQPLVYTGREIQKRISYVLGGYGLPDDWVILGIQDIEAAKAQAVPEGFVLVEKAKIKTWFQDDDEPENFCSEESEIADLADLYETGEIIKINRLEDCVISVTPLYGTWKIDRIDQEGDVYRSFVLCDSYYEAEKVIVSNKEVDDEWLLAQQAQDPAND